MVHQLLEGSLCRMKQSSGWLIGMYRRRKMRLRSWNLGFIYLFDLLFSILRYKLFRVNILINLINSLRNIYDLLSKAQMIKLWFACKYSYTRWNTLSHKFMWNHSKVPSPIDKGEWNWRGSMSVHDKFIVLTRQINPNTHILLSFGACFSLSVVELKVRPYRKLCWGCLSM